MLRKLLLLFAATALVSCTSSEDKLGNQVVVKVNNSELKAKVFAQKLAQNLRSLDALSVKNPSLLEQYKTDIVREYIVSVVTSDWARANSLIVHRKDLEKKINSIRANYPDDLAFRRALAAQGISFDIWREKVRNSLLQRIVILHLLSQSKEPNDEELKAFYKVNKKHFEREAQVRIRQILVDSKNNAERIYKELRNGKKLKDLAKQYSIGPEAQKEGDIGWLQKGTLDIFDKAFDMRVGQKSRILKSSYGYHIFEVTGKRPKKTLSFKNVKDRIKRTIMEKREQGIYSSWLEGQIRSARVYKNDKLISSISIETRGEN